ncbi:MAG: M16 family metallopeptidase [Mucilaginibacter sp.]
MKIPLTISLICLISYNLALAQQPRLQDSLPLDAAVKTGRLANGFTYYIRHNEEPKHRVVMYLVNKVGSVLEDEDQRGLAHFMEHMSFNGTAHFPHNELVNYLQKAGIRFGADINAYTSFDETVYQLPLPSDNPDLLNKALLIMHDWAQYATLDSIEIEKERGVVLEEKRLGKGAGERMQGRYWRMLLNYSRYANRLPIGSDTVLNNFKRSAISRFYHNWYRPDLQALIIVGDINADSLVSVIRAKFADLKNPADEKSRPTYKVPLTGSNQFMAVTDKEMPETVAEVDIKHPGTIVITYGDYKNQIIKELFNRMLAGRCAELTQLADPPFVSGHAGISDLIGNISMFDATMVARPGQLEKGFKAIWREVERTRRFGFTSTELERAKNGYLSSMEQALAEKDKTNSEKFVKEYQALFLKGSASPGIAIEYAMARKGLTGIKLSDLDKLAKDFITGTNRDILLLAPDKDKAALPDEVTFNKWISQVGNEVLQPYQDKVSDQPLLTSQPGPGKIVLTKHDKSLNITIYTLSNGLKVVIKPTNFKNDQILFNGFAEGGTSLAPDADYQSAENAANVITGSGLGNYDAGQLAKYLEGKQLEVQPYIGERFEGVSGSTTNNDLETALQMTYAYFTQPRKDQRIFDGIISRSRAGLLRRSDDPKSVFSDTVRATLSNNNPRRTGPSIEKLNQINLEKCYAFYKERFGNASDFTFTFVGSIDTNVLKPLLEKYMASLPATNRHEHSKDLGIHIPGGRISKNIYKGSEHQSTVLLVYSGTFDYTPVNRLRLDALKECLEIRLLQRLREDESGVYSPGVFINVTKLPEARYSLIIQFGCAPQNVDKLIASASDEISKLRKDGPLQENLDKWKAGDRLSKDIQLRSNGFWLSYITGQLQNGDPVEDFTGYESIRSGLTVRDVMESAGQCLKPDNFIRLVLLPDSLATAN